jgi:hypothetical protein
MTQDEIIEMAKQAGIEEAYSLKHNQYLVRFKDGSLEAFAKLVEEKALAEHAMRETQRLGQEIEQEPVVHDPLPRACNLAGVDYQTFLKIKAYMPVAPPQRTEQNFCSRCGKRTKDIHTCTPPQENT